MNFSQNYTILYTVETVKMNIPFVDFA